MDISQMMTSFSKFSLKKVIPVNLFRLFSLKRSMLIFEQVEFQYLLIIFYKKKYQI